jgi:DNA-binding LytR/AlgR family response regulator
MNTALRVVIADDERPARSFLAATLRGFEDVKLIGEAENGMETIELIERERPDLALLDLQMPEIDGLGVVRLLKKSRMPLVAFVTAYDEYAVRAFELNAVDYLYTIAYRLKDLEARLDPARFVRLGRGALANVEMMRRVGSMPGGTYIVTMSNGQQLTVSRIQGRVLREHLLKL